MTETDGFAALQPIRDRAGIVAKLGPPRPGDDLTGAAHRSAADVPRLLKAAEDVLKLADDWEQVSALHGYECAAALREAITAALAGKEAGDADPR